jgi:regulator of protease activity HflC (stomatin/prohibitin superfamily)
MAALIALFGLLFVFAFLGLKIISEHEQGLVARFGAHARVLGPGLHFIVPFVDEVRVIDLRDVAVTTRIEASSAGKVRIGDEAWDARTTGSVAIDPGTPIRIAGVDGRVLVVAAVT